MISIFGFTFSVDAGNGWFDADLDVCGTVTAANMTATSLVSAPNISATSNITAGGYVGAGDLKIRSESISLSSTSWAILTIGGARGAGFLFVKSASNDRPAATSNFADDSSNDTGTINRTASHDGYNSTCTIEAWWPGNSKIQIRKDCTSYDGTYRVGMTFD
ncbi:MAG: hypothetical protein GY822_08950 [Deltaproteobacteria bacterium]|nr:hypothetical protein [Deltaproteobacteria bacterium]